MTTTHDGIDAQLDTRARAPHYDAVNRAYAELSAAARRRWLRHEGVAYGPHPLEAWDLLGPADPKGVMVWFHGGFWRSRDRADFHFLADGFARRGLATVAVGYPKCPAVGLDRVVASAVAAVDDVLRRATALGIGGIPVLVGGHSAGAHLATMATLARPDRIAGLAAVSGLYDLEPVRHSFANAHLHLDAEAAQTLSPVLVAQRKGALPRAAFLVGSDETAEFHRQAQAQHAAWRQTGRASLSVLPAADHYTILFAIHGGSLGSLAGILPPTLARNG